jgi:hypothetical protein
VKAREGDWLVVKSRTDHTQARRGMITAVRTSDGSPPYTVRWADDGHEGLVFPGPDAEVVSAADAATLLKTESERIARIQSEIRAGSHSG